MGVVLRVDKMKFKKNILIFGLLILIAFLLPNISADVVDSDSSIGLVVSPTEINLNLVASSDSKEITTVTRVIRVSNYFQNTAQINIIQIGLEDMVLIEETFFNLSSGQSKDVEVIFTAPSQEGVINGKILVGDREVLVSLKVNPSLLLPISDPLEENPFPKSLIIILILIVIVSIISRLIKKRKITN